MPKELPRDLLNDSTREVVFRRKNGKLFDKIAKQSKFNRHEVEALALIHRKIVETRGPLSRGTFRDVFHASLNFTENKRHLLIDRVFSQFDKRNTLQLSHIHVKYVDLIPMEDWVSTFSSIIYGSVDEKTGFAYKIYDLMRSNKLTKEQIFPMLRGCLIKLQPEEDAVETVKDMIELLVKAIDIDRDGDVSADEFRRAVLNKNLLYLQCMGPVFPAREAAEAFLTTFTARRL